MALTPEDVVNKRFQATKFREGYDQDEVDDFLDEVVVELRRLNGENDELRQRLTAAEARAAEAVRNAQAAAAAAPVPAPAAAPATAFAEPASPPPTVAVPTQVAAPQSEFDEQTSTTNLLQLARRLHEEHVREGVEKRDALIAEGHATAARVVAEAEAKSRQQMTVLDQERVALEKSVDELRIFEREYRQKLKSYIEGQLRDLDTAAPVQVSGGQGFSNPVSAPTRQAEPAAPTFQGFGG
ncbi:DivIVA domain-containing protein [Agromyces protaetiae]|uniref:Cell wall synthesis protein Wag31 n=1 Tax=Agromyces protaetiae TaxID=2509455 RepID=A0A4P6FDH3_9MICO|nr:DivIVA domain-containing protein [Agromyces protaetiae]QAY74172.1 DivIVA domain-containing protein [Agromyces protaetiae]